MPAADFTELTLALAAEGFVGANVTIPHKEAALALAGDASAAATEIGAANTLSFEGGEVRAANTDAPGLLAALPQPPSGMRGWCWVRRLGLGGGLGARGPGRCHRDLEPHRRARERARAGPIRDQRRSGRASWRRFRRSGPRAAACA